MARVGVSKKKSPRGTELSQLKKKLRSVTDQLESCDRELEQRKRRIARGAGASNSHGGGARHHQPLTDGRAAGARRHRRKRRSGLWN